MNQNKTSKYFKYAIGEIVLVVIGILIALQINNWNENRKSENSSNKYLKALQTETENNVETLSNYLPFLKGSIAFTGEALNKLTTESAKNLQDSTIINLLEGTMRPLFPREMERAVFDDIISSGMLENINDLELKKSIFKIGTEISNYKYVISTAEKSWTEYLKPYNLKYTIALTRFDSIGNVKFPLSNFKVERDKYINNREFSNYLKIKIITYNDLVKNIEFQIKRSTDLVKQLEEKMGEQND